MFSPIVDPMHRLSQRTCALGKCVVDLDVHGDYLDAAVSAVTRC